MSDEFTFNEDVFPFEESQPDTTSQLSNHYSLQTKVKALFFDEIDDEYEGTEESGVTPLMTDVPSNSPTPTDIHENC